MSCGKSGCDIVRALDNAVGANRMVVPSPSLLRLAPSPPVIKSKEVRSCEEAALICWESGNLNPVDSYTVELTQAETPGAAGVTE